MTLALRDTSGPGRPTLEIVLNGHVPIDPETPGKVRGRGYAARPPTALGVCPVEATGLRIVPACFEARGESLTDLARHLVENGLPRCSGGHTMGGP